MNFLTSLPQFISLYSKIVSFTRCILNQSPFLFRKRISKLFLSVENSCKVEHSYSTTFLSLIGIEILFWLFSLKNKSERNGIKLSMPKLICTCCFHMYLFSIFTCALLFILQNLFTIQDDAKLLLWRCYTDGIHNKINFWRYLIFQIQKTCCSFKATMRNRLYREPK